ncbi:MAG: succinylglutamate desuccinylase/aspartoacylase family protein [Synergistaceae bacterium]|nr:succinylglutamate desuccinylase/aspartoacylase family protein [Synergistaceae bacterium]
MELRIKGTKTTAFILCVLCTLVCWYSAAQFLSMRKPDLLMPAQGFQKHMLSEWEPRLEGTNMDTPVYIQDGTESGGTVYVQGGIHANEPAGFMAAIVLLENARVRKGRLIIAPFINNSARTHNSPQDAAPQSFKIEQEGGNYREFKFGSRATNPIDQWPDPDIYIHRPSGQKLDGSSRSNMNRSFPGDVDDGITQLAGKAVMELLKKEKVNLAFDLHEASPEYPVVNAMVAHESAMELAAMVCMTLESEGIPMRLEPSPVNLRGLSHREWGDSIQGLMPILMESGNPSQGRLRGRTDEALVLTGRDKAYEKASKMGLLFIPYDGYQSIALRTARHVTGVRVAAEMLGDISLNDAVIFEGIPSYTDIKDNGIGKWLGTSGL